MPPSTFRSRRNLTVLAGALVTCAGFAFVMLGKDHADASDHGDAGLGHLLVVIAWGLLLPLAYVFNRFRIGARFERAAMARPAAEAFQSKRYRLLMVIGVYIGVLLTPLSMVNALRLTPATTLIDRLFDAALLLGPCGLAIGMMTSAIYPRSMGLAVDDELVALHRAKAFGAGFAACLGLAAAGLVVATIRPAWALATIPLAIGGAVTAMTLRFALLERAAQRGE